MFIFVGGRRSTKRSFVPVKNSDDEDEGLDWTDSKDDPDFAPVDDPDFDPVSTVRI